MVRTQSAPAKKRKYVYEIVVGGVGIVYYGTSKKQARAAFHHNVDMVLSARQGACVTAFRGRSVVKEFDPCLGVDYSDLEATYAEV